MGEPIASPSLVRGTKCASPSKCPVRVSADVHCDTYPHINFGETNKWARTYWNICAKCDNVLIHFVANVHTNQLEIEGCETTAMWLGNRRTSTQCRKWIISCTLL